MKYVVPSTAPEDSKEFQIWVLDELRHISDAMDNLETDTLTLPELNAEPDKLYNGLVVLADGTNWDPGSGQGFYGYSGGSWAKL